MRPMRLAQRFSEVCRGFGGNLEQLVSRMHFTVTLLHVLVVRHIV
jgi:hypothetical protein